MSGAVHLLCFFTSLICAVLLLRGYRRSGARLLLWSGLFFIGMALNNGFLFVDLILMPEVDLFLLRSIPALVGTALLLYGMVWEDE